MEIPKRTFHRLLYANSEYPFVKFALADDDRPMLMTELPTSGLSRDELGRGLARLAIVADRLLEETLPAVADRGILPDWSGRVGRNAPTAGGLPGRGGSGHARMAATRPPQGTPRPDRPPAGHARLSLSPAVRAVASVAADPRAARCRVDAGAASPATPGRTSGGIQHEDGGDVRDRPGRGKRARQHRRHLPEHHTQPAGAVQRLPDHRPGGARRGAERARRGWPRSASADDAAGARRRERGQRPAPTPGALPRRPRASRCPTRSTMAPAPTCASARRW